MSILRIFGCSLILLGSASACREPIDQRAMSLMDEKRYQEVIDLVEPALEATPGDYELSTVYGAALLRNGQPSLAVWPLRRAYKDAPEGSPAGGLLVEAMVLGGAIREGIELADELLEQDPDDLRLLRMRARGHAGNLNREAALEDIERLIEASPDNVYNVETKVNLLTEMDRLEEAAAAIAQLKELLEAQDLPREGMARFCGAEGEFLRKHGRDEEAEAHFTTCLEEFPGEPDVVAPALQFYDAIGEHARGLEMLAEQAESPNGKNRLRIQGLLAQVLARDGRGEEGEAVLVDFTNRYPDAPQPWLELADLYAAHDKMEEAGEVLEKAIEITTGISPGDLGFVYISLSEETRFAYADIMIQVGNFDRVREILRHIDEPAHKLLIEARLKLAEGDPQGALDTYEEAFTLWPSNPGGRYLAGVAALRLGKTDLASEMFQDSMRADAEATDAGAILTRMKFLSEQPVGVLEVGGFYSRANTQDIVVPRMMLLAAAAIGATPAMEGLRELITARGKPGQANGDYASALQATAGREAAIEYLDGIDSLDEPDFAPALGVWLGLMISRGDGEVALERVSKAYKAHPESASILLVKSNALRAVASDPAGALAALDRASELDPGLASVRVARGHHFEARGD
nr:tetratricopeptide repeat protein [Myxococcota bacterium]